MVISVPDSTEYAAYYSPYIDKVAGNDVLAVLEAQLGQTLPVLEHVSEERSLPSFDQDAAVTIAVADERPWSSHVDEFKSIRAGTLTLFRNLPADAWMRRGVASGNPFTVRALAYICAGHVTHHVNVLQERYLTG